jgi:hypothetical protein
VARSRPAPHPHVYYPLRQRQAKPTRTHLVRMDYQYDAHDWLCSAERFSSSWIWLACCERTFGHRFQDRVCLLLLCPEKCAAGRAGTQIPRDKFSAVCVVRGFATPPVQLHFPSTNGVKNVPHPSDSLLHRPGPTNPYATPFNRPSAIRFPSTTSWNC